MVSYENPSKDGQVVEPNYTPEFTNGDTVGPKMMGLEKGGIPALNMAFFGIFVQKLSAKAIQHPSFNTMVYLERRTYKQCFIVSLDSLEHPDTFYVPGALSGCSGWFAHHRI